MSAVEHFRQIARDVLAYGALAAVARVSGLLLLPVLTRVFSLEDYGVIDLFSVSVAFVAIFLRMALPSAVNRHYHACDGPEERSRLVGTCLILVAAAGAGCSGVAWLALRLALLGGWTLPLAPGIVLLGFATASLLALSSVAEAVLRAERRILHFNAVSFVGTGVSLALTLWWVVSADAGLIMVFVAQGIGAACGLAFALWAIHRQVALEYAPETAREVLRFGLPLLPAILVSWTNEQVDRLVLVWLSGLGGVAIYAAAAKTALVFQIATTMFRQAWRPYSMTLIDDEDRNAVYRTILQAYMTGFAILGLVFTAGSKEIFALLVPEVYGQGIRLMPWLVGSALLQQSIAVTNVGLLVSKQTAQIGAASSLTVALNIAISVPLILHVGIAGAAIGSFIALLALSALLLHRSNREAAIDFRWQGFLGPVAVYLMASLATIELQAIESVATSLAARVAVVIIGSALIYRCSIDRAGRRALHGLIQMPSVSGSRTG